VYHRSLWAAVETNGHLRDQNLRTAQKLYDDHRPYECGLLTIASRDLFGAIIPRAARKAIVTAGLADALQQLARTTHVAGTPFLN
jgi:hypothetical protein